MDQIYVKHNAQRSHQIVNELLLLCHQQRTILRHNETSIDLIDGGRDCVGDDPPRIRWQLHGAVRLRVGDELTTIEHKKFQGATQMDPSIRLFGTLDVHGVDQILLLAEEDGETPGELDPFPIVDCAALLFDDNINLMRRAPNVQ